MPPTEHSHPDRTFQDVVNSLGTYPIDAFRFIEEGLGFTVEQLHPAPAATTKAATSVKGKLKMAAAANPQPEPRHITGQQLCEGLRDYALSQWGQLAATVLRRWHIHETLDFGKIVYALIDAGMMQKTDRDSLEDFRAVYDFKSAFEDNYRIEAR